ncbi:thiopeptide-type bacteriocin biosynthesis protein [Streptomyces sp. NPDC059411]|uniref:thiopeptide-type bacteriocin biosynthesis protein n=1 Tax=Streptomyces sp. NPDC059411 TaxID=3346825 RepID=UPI0036AF436D
MTPPTLAPDRLHHGFGLGPAAVERDWLYYRIFVRDYRDLTPLIDHTVRRIVAAAHVLNPQGGWFFLRYVDESGMQVRLRHHGPLDAVAAVEAAADRILADTAAMPPELARAYRGHAKGLYEPEHAKFGGPTGVRLAERASQAASEAALELIGPDFPRLRLGHALAATLSALELLPADQRLSFAYHMTWYWTGQNGDRSDPLRTRVDAAARRAGPDLRRLLDLVREGPYRRVHDEYRLGLRVLLEQHRAAGIPRTGPHLLFHLIHLTNNRLGVKPTEEAVLARWIRAEYGAET